MVGIVLVSHSRALAKAALSLVRQVASPQVQIEIAAGTGNDHAEFGTDATEISAAIQLVFNPQGVLVLMDLGSAILSAETALELLPVEIAAGVRLCPAPFVEGAIAAAIQAGLNSDINIVYAEAVAALRPKHDQLELAVDKTANSDVAQVVNASGSSSITVTIRNKHGLHLRPAARFVQIASAYNVDVVVQRADSSGPTVSGKSLSQLMSLGVSQGDVITITAKGKDSADAIRALNNVVSLNLNESEAEPVADVSRPPVSASVGGLPLGSYVIPVSEGIAIGHMHRYVPASPVPTVPTTQPKTFAPDVEWTRLQRAIQQVDESISARATRLIALGDARASDIFQAHRVILQDEALLAHAHDAITQKGLRAEAGLQSAVEHIVAQYRALPDSYLSQRAGDVMDVGAQVLLRLSDTEQKVIEPDGVPVIEVADDFTPTAVAEMAAEQVGGLISLAGSANSHAAILARALGVPAVAGAAAAMNIDSIEGATVAFDGATGELWVDPAQETIQLLNQKRDQWDKRRLELMQASQPLSRTRDGRRIEIAANLSGFADARLAVAQGAEAVGVLRTEFLYLTRTVAPSEDEQVTALRQIAVWMEGRPVIVRTLDVGGDKILPYLTMPVEANPFLGVRAIRLSLQHQDLFTTQLRAILRAGIGHDLRILLPMVTLVEELKLVRQLIERAHETLSTEGVEHAWPVQVGIMVETPAAALMATALAPYTDFYSIGTNDLTQYTLAAERGNSQLAQFSDALHPAVLRLIDEVTRVTHQHGKWVAVCGEMASEPVAIPILIGIGVDELSMNINAIPLAKSIVRNVELVAAQALARAALKAASAAEVRALTPHSF